MSSSRATLERIGARVPVPQPAFDRMMRRRDRKVRNRRIATAAVALILAAVAIGGAIRVLGQAEWQAPANPGLDRSFGSDGVVTTSISEGKDEAHAVAIAPDGKVVVAGGSDGEAEFALARYETDGMLDTSFGDGGTVTTDFSPATDVAFGVAIQADGKIVAAGAAGEFSAFALARYDADGTLDATFGDGGKVTMNFAGTGSFARSVAIQADGKIVAAGPSAGGGAADFALARFSADGTLDTSFGDGGTITTAFHNRDDPWEMTIQPDGKIVAVGFGAQSLVLARYDADGTLDPTFGVAGQVTGQDGAAFGVTLQADGKIVVTGIVDSAFGLVRYRPDGTLDRSFGERGSVTSTQVDWEPGARVATLPDGEIVGVAKGPGFTVARFLPSGVPDTSFGTGGISTIDLGSGFGASSVASAVAVGPDGAIVAAGSSTRSEADSDFALVRYPATSEPAPAAGSSSAPTFVFYLGLAAAVAILIVARRARRRSR